MAKYQCGNRQCTDADLDQMEAIKSGKLKIVDASVPAAEPAGDNPQLKSMCELFPDLCRRVETLGNQVDELYNDRHGHPVPDEGLVEALENADKNCPDCRAKVRTFVLPELAKRLGYSLIPAKPAEPAPEPDPAAQPAITSAPVPGPDSAAQPAITSAPVTGPDPAAQPADKSTADEKTKDTGFAVW